MTIPIRRQRIEGPPLARTLEIRADAILSEEERRIRISFSSETPVLRSSWFEEPWVEILGHQEGEVDLDRINAAGPVHDYHAPAKDGGILVGGQIGVVDRAWLEGGRGQAEIRRSQREDVGGLWQDIQDGIVRNVSVGYKIHERALLRAVDDGPNEYRVTRWTPSEINFVDMPADDTVGVGRRNPDTPQPFRITDLPETTGPTQRGNTMAAETTQAQAPETPQARQTDPAPAVAPAVDLDAVRASARKDALDQERDRRTAIRTLCEPLRQAHDFVSGLEARALDGDTTADQLGQQILRKLGENARPLASDPAPAPGGDSITAPGEDERDKLIRGVGEALLVRAAVRTADKRPDLKGNPWRGASLLDLARGSLERAGSEFRGIDKRELVARAFTQTGSDFPVLLENVMHKALLAGYNIAPDTWRRFCATGSVSDFRDHNRYQLGSLGNLDALNDAGEFKSKAIPDGRKEKVSIATKGNIINLTRQTIINDDLGAFIGLAEALRRAGRRTIEATAYSTMALNAGMGPVLNNGKTLFHADHGNIVASGGVPSVAEVEKCMLLMAAQMDLSGNDYLDLSPSVWLGPKSLEVTARVLNASTSDPDAPAKSRSDLAPNPFQNYFSDLIGSSRLSGTPWYVLASPGEAPVLEVSFLDGEEEPFLDMEEGFDVDGARYKARLFPRGEGILGEGD